MGLLGTMQNGFGLKASVAAGGGGAAAGEVAAAFALTGKGSKIKWGQTLAPRICFVADSGAIVDITLKGDELDALTFRVPPGCVDLATLPRTG